MSLPHGPWTATRLLTLCTAAFGLGGPPAFADETAPMAQPPVSGPGTGPDAWPVLGALGGAVRIAPEHPGAVRTSTGVTPNFVLRWGRVTVSNGGPLASRFGEPVEAGLGADLLDVDHLRISASLSVDQGRRSGDVARLVGVHDIPSHLRGRLRVGWRLHSRWEAMAVWRTDLSGRGTGNSADLTLLHDWRPEFIDHRRWRISLGATVEVLDARRANLIHGITEEDAQRSRLPAYRLGAGTSEWRLFTNGQRELGDGWVAYGSMGFSRLVGEAAGSPIVLRPHGVSASVGLGRRF